MFRYKSFGFHRIRSWDGTEMEPNPVPKWDKCKKPPENLVPNPWYREAGTRIEVPEPVLWQRRNRGFSTKTGTELKKQYCINTSSCPRYTTFQIVPILFLLITLAFKFKFCCHLLNIMYIVLCLKVWSPREWHFLTVAYIIVERDTSHMQSGQLR